jgi:hypothetical protein
MRYMMFFKHTEDYANVQVPAGLYEAMGTFIDEAARSGNFVGGAGLLPTAHGNKVKLRGGKITVTDGPFTESKEIVGGYALIDAGSKEEALDIARRFMELHLKHWPTFEGECEVRPLEAEAQPTAYSSSQLSVVSFQLDTRRIH